jgi:virginiamycin B lyase
MRLDDRGRAAARAARQAVDGLPPPPPPALLRARQRRRSTLVAALILAMVVASGGVVWHNLAVEQAPVAPPRPVPALPRHVQARIPVAGGPAAVTVGAGAVWVASQDGGTVSRIDPASNRVVATITGVPTSRVRSTRRSYPRITAAAGAVWVANDLTTARIDPASNRVTATWPVGPGTGELLITQDALWISQDDGTVLRVDPATGRPVASVRVASGAGLMSSGLASLDGAVWASTGAGVMRIDPRTNRPGPPIEVGLVPAGGLAAAAGSLWLAMDDGTVLRIDPASRRVTARVAVGGRPFAVAASDAGVFVTDQDAALITRIDPATNRVAGRIPIPAWSAIAVGAGAGWAADAQANAVFRIDPHASG